MGCSAKFDRMLQHVELNETFDSFLTKLMVPLEYLTA